MRLLFGSDFHVEHGGDVAGQLLPYIVPRETILLAGGDISVAGSTVRAMADLASKLGCMVVGIPGNHDYYGLNLAEADAQFRAEAAQTHGFVTFLNNESIVLGETHLWASCFWTDFSRPTPNEVTAARLAFHQGIADARAIRIPSTSSLRPFDLLSASDVEGLHRIACASLEDWLNECDRLAVPREKRLVMTHFTPTPALIQKKYQGSPFNGYFAPDASRYFPRVGTWLCGHTHGPGEVTLNGCRVINGSMGYPGEIANWAPVELGAA